MIVSTSDFIGMIELAQVNSSVDIGVSVEYPVQSDLNILITIKEPEVLTKLLTFTFYRLFRDGLAATTPEQRWLDLRDGKEWTNDGGTTYFDFVGLKKLAAQYIYFYYQRKEATQTTGVGEAVNKTENATRISPIQKQVTAWNDMVEMVKQAYHYLNQNEAIYPEWNAAIDSTYQYNDRYFPAFSWLYCGYFYRWRHANELLTTINTHNI